MDSLRQSRFRLVDLLHAWTMPLRYVPITMGSPRFHTAEVDGFRVTEAWFPARSTLPSHRHDRATFAVMLEGSFDVIFAGKTLACAPSCVFTEPIAERHGNQIQPRGAHVLVLQPDPERTELFRPCRTLLDELHHFHHPGIAGMAWRLARELRSGDDLSPLSIEGVGLEMLALGARLRETAAAGGAAPAWLLQAQELLHARFTESLRITEIASAVGVHPVHLARVFRARFRTPLGTYVRKLRLESAAAQLSSSRDAISRIALEAGFSDQSHFTRAFKRHTGLTPDAYRRALRR